MPTGRKAAALDDRHLMRHVGVRRIVGNRVDAGLRHNLTRPVFLAMAGLRANLSTICETEFN
jgi:hypothetical protein